MKLKLQQHDKLTVHVACPNAATGTTSASDGKLHGDVKKVAQCFSYQFQLNAE